MVKERTLMYDKGHSVYDQKKYNKTYYERHKNDKEMIYTCELCNKEVKKLNKTQHERTIKHQQNVFKKEEDELRKHIRKNKHHYVKIAYEELLQDILENGLTSDEETDEDEDEDDDKQEAVNKE